MLTLEEVNTIRSAVRTELIAQATRAHQNEVQGIRQSMDDLHEVMLYNFALENYIYGSTLNALLSSQVEDIYSRLRELRDVE